MQKLTILTVALLTVAAGVCLRRFPQGLLHAAEADSLIAQVQNALPAKDSPTPGPASNPEVADKTDEAPPVDESPEARQLLQEAKNRLYSYSSVQAAIREQVTFGPRQLRSEGSYIAGPFDPLPKLRLEYRVAVGKTQGSLTEVCDGQLLWTQRVFTRTPPPDATDPPEPQIQVTRRDVKMILDAVYKNGSSPRAILQAELGLGGLPALLASIERVMILDAVRTEQIEGRAYRIVTGQWKPDFLRNIRRQFKQIGRELGPYIPEQVEITLEGDSLFPVRIAYLRRGGEDEPTQVTVLTLEFSDIRLNQPLPPEAFEFMVPKGVEAVDVTQQFIQAIQAETSEEPEPGN